MEPKSPLKTERGRLTGFLTPGLLWEKSSAMLGRERGWSLGAGCSPPSLVSSYMDMNSVLRLWAAAAPGSKLTELVLVFLTEE